LINEDGNQNERVDDVTHWLNELLAEYLADGSLATGNSDPEMGSTGTGLDALVVAISTDAELNRRLPDSEIKEGAEAADAMNQIIVDGIIATGIANNGKVTSADVKLLADWIIENHEDEWIIAHGNDESAAETGFHLVQNDGAVDRLYAESTVNTVADGLYHLGFGYNDRNRLINEDGDQNASLTFVAHWLNELLADDLAGDKLRNDAVDLYPTGSTGTALDGITGVITSDANLTQRYTATELADIAQDVDTLNGR